jgi:hypothetical protein
MSFLAKSSVKQSSQQAGEITSSPLLFSLLNSLDPEKRYEILETCPPSRSTIEYLSRYRCKLYISSSSTELTTMNTEQLDSAQKLNRAFVKALNLHKNHKAQLNVLLFWDLPNYIQPDIFPALIEYLLPHISKDATLHCYIHTSSLMPEEPGQYHILDDNSIRISNPAPRTRTCPCYYQEALHKLMNPFRVKRSILHTNGTQEYLLSR